MQQVEKATFRDKLCHHVEALDLVWVKADTHVEHDVWVAKLIQHLDLLDKVLHSFAIHTPLAKLFNSYTCTIPPRLENIAKATLTKQCSWGLIPVQLRKINKDVEAVLVERLQKTGIMPKSHQRLILSCCYRRIFFHSRAQITINLQFVSKLEK